MSKKPILLTSKEVKRLKELEQLLMKYKNILGLEKEDIDIGISAKNRAFLQWYEKEKKWGIYLLPSDNDFTPIHELGHIFLTKKTDYMYFAGSGIKKNKIFEGLFLILNHLLDCFVDYNLIQFKGLYELYIDDAHLWKDAKNKGNIKGEPINIVHSYKTIIGYYLSLKIIDKMKNHEYFISVKNYLRKAKRFIQKFYPNNKFNFQSLEQKLDEFDKIKDTKDPKVIINFFYKILYEISIWNKREIQSQMKLLFPSTN
ncbi:MAG: hypothetical protein ACFFCE_09255 [Promethearchaeota archaeon]